MRTTFRDPPTSEDYSYEKGRREGGREEGKEAGREEWKEAEGEGEGGGREGAVMTVSLIFLQMLVMELTFTSLTRELTIIMKLNIPILPSLFFPPPPFPLSLPPSLPPFLPQWYLH